MNNRIVLMVSNNEFPNGDAGAIRDLSFANIYRKLGYTPILFCANKYEKTGEYESIKFVSLFRPAHSTIDKLIRFLSYKRRFVRELYKIETKYGIPSLLHIYGATEPVINYLIKYSQTNNCRIIFDSVEWYSPCEFAHGKLDKAYILKDRLNRKIIRNPIRVIGISTYLTDHFRTRGLNAVRIPVIMDVKNTKTSVNDDEKVKLIYAGNPGNKDYLKEIVLGVTLLSEGYQKKLELHILGASEDQIRGLIGIQRLPNCIKAYGRVSREQVEEVMIGMDFAVLLRPSEERYTKAGFPTKSVEAMSHGVAMICNLSSDLGMYLRDGENAIVVDGYDANAFSNSVERVLSLNRTEIDMIKHNARQLAEESFDYRGWINTVSDLIGEK